MNDDEAAIYKKWTGMLDNSGERERKKLLSSLEDLDHYYYWVPSRRYRERLRAQHPRLHFMGITPGPKERRPILCLASAKYSHKDMRDMLAKYPDAVSGRISGVIQGLSSFNGFVGAATGQDRLQALASARVLGNTVINDTNQLDNVGSSASMFTAAEHQLIAEAREAAGLEPLEDRIPKESSSDMATQTTQNTLKQAAINGAKLGAVHASGEALIDLAKKLAPEVPMISVMLETTEGREAVKILLATAIRYSAGAFPGQEQTITMVTDLQITSSVALLTGKYMGLIGETVANMTKNVAALAVPPVQATFPANAAAVESVTDAQYSEVRR